MASKELYGVSVSSGTYDLYVDVPKAARALE